MAQHRDLLPSTEVDEPTPQTTAPGHVSHKTDLLHPLTKLTWEHCQEPPWQWRRVPAHCAVLQDRVALLATSTHHGDEIYTSSSDLHWNEFEVPYDRMSLTIYQSKFVLVGGYNPYTREVINTVFTSTTGQQWEPSLPPMPTKRYATSSVSTTSPEVLVVAGGIGSDSEELNIVEVLMGENWLTTDYLPTPGRNMASTVHEGNLYFMTRSPYPNTIMTCSCTSLISSCTDSSRTTSTDSPLWRQFEAPHGHWSIISYSSQLVIIDRWGTTRSYSSTTQSWVQASIAGDGPRKSHEDNVNNSIATVLPTGKILYCYRGGVYRGTISMSSYSPEIKFPHNVITRLEAVMGIQIMSVLAELHSTLASSSGLNLEPVIYHGQLWWLPDSNKEPARYVEDVILRWYLGGSHRPPTWRQLLTVLQDIGLVQLSQQIEEFINGLS